MSKRKNTFRVIGFWDDTNEVWAQDYDAADSDEAIREAAAEKIAEGHGDTFIVIGAIEATPSKAIKFAWVADDNNMAAYAIDLVEVG